MSENKVLTNTRTFAPRDNLSGGRRKLPNDNLQNFYSLPNIIGLFKSRLRD
jgi:hypothetical protein